MTTKPEIQPDKPKVKYCECGFPQSEPPHEHSLPDNPEVLPQWIKTSASKIIARVIGAFPMDHDGDREHVLTHKSICEIIAAHCPPASLRDAPEQEPSVPVKALDAWMENWNELLPIKAINQFDELINAAEKEQG